MKSPNLDKFSATRRVKRSRRYVAASTGPAKRAGRRAARRRVADAMRRGDFEARAGYTFTEYDVT